MTFTILTLCSLCFSAAPIEQGPAGRLSQWREDINYIATELPARHKEFYQLISKDTFDRSIAELNRDVPQLSDSEIILRLTRLVASLGVAHTCLELPSGTEKCAFRVYPIRMEWFSDGLAVVSAARQYRAALGCRVVRIGPMKPEQAVAAMTPYVSYESETKLYLGSAFAMKYVELMQHVRIANAAGHLSLRCATPNGKTFVMDVAPLPYGETGTSVLSARRAFQTPTPFCEKNPKAFYWYEYLPDSRTLYIQYRKCADEPGNPFADFVQKMFAFADAQTMDCVIIDLRYNGGGSSGIVNSLINELKKRPALCERGHLYALIGGHTFSSAIFAVNRLQGDLHAILIGQPTGNKPNHFGQVASFELPNSKLKVKYSTKHFHMVRNGDPRSFDPDIDVPYSLEDFLAGRDPVFDAALRRPLK
jgi:hypothetical protein